jgi:nucleoside 2-deoxyribosyltransferase
MAFRRGETDKVYDNLIVPLLRKKKITPVRVDRQEHLDDINNKIISELKQSDFAIADLTFARPSVYYEAGFAQRCIPVIHTSRRDHFHPKPDDKFGNFKIHFDLQMKNIIPWSNASDKNFIKNLIEESTMRRVH